MSLKTIPMKLVRSEKWKMLILNKINLKSLIFYLVNFQATGHRYCPQNVYDVLNLFLRGKKAVIVN